MDSNNIKSVHFIGIGGVGMSGIARVAHDQGMTVTGSDMKESRYTRQLKEAGVKVAIGQHSASNIPGTGADDGPDVVVVTTAVLDNNPELIAAKERGLTIWHRAQMLARLGVGLDTVAIAGTHGKTTTSSMVASALDKMGVDPTFLIGGIVRSYGSNAHSGTGRYYVVEADESDKSFRYLSPAAVLVTNIEADLEAISQVCHEYDIPLFVDGARLGYGLMSPECDITLPDLAKLADVFYIGGTKQGALFGEAVVISNAQIQRDFRYNIKQNGGMLAKGRLLGIQFETLFTDNLYFRLAQNAIGQAMRVKKALKEKGYQVYKESPTNQQFPIMDKKTYERLSKDFLFDFWGNVDADHVAVRICTSWATKSEYIDQLIERL